MSFRRRYRLATGGAEDFFEELQAKVMGERGDSTDLARQLRETAERVANGDGGGRRDPAIARELQRLARAVELGEFAWPPSDMGRPL